MLLPGTHAIGHAFAEIGRAHDGFNACPAAGRRRVQIISRIAGKPRVRGLQAALARVLGVSPSTISRDFRAFRNVLLVDHARCENTTNMSTSITPVFSPLGANSSFKTPSGPLSCSDQTIQQAKQNRAMPSVKLRSTSAPRNRGSSILKPWSV